MRILKKFIRAMLFRLKAILSTMPRTKEIIKVVLRFVSPGKNQKIILKDNIAYEETLLLELVAINLSLNKEIYPDSANSHNNSKAIKSDNLKNANLPENLELDDPVKITEARAYLKELRYLTKSIAHENYLLLLEKQHLTNKL
jgi:hypothetical protein